MHAALKWSACSTFDPGPQVTESMQLAVRHRIAEALNLAACCAARHGLVAAAVRLCSVCSLMAPALPTGPYGTAAITPSCGAATGMAFVAGATWNHAAGRCMRWQLLALLVVVVPGIICAQGRRVHDRRDKGECVHTLAASTHAWCVTVTVKTCRNTLNLDTGDVAPVSHASQSTHMAMPYKR
jgi:hypothetical protein